MSKRVVLVDDLTGDETDVQSLEFALRGVRYRIDLSAVNTKKLDEFLAPYVAAAERLGAPATPRKRSGGQPARPEREQLQAIRDWAEGQGIKVSARGRIAQSTVDAFNAAHTKS